MLEYKKFNTQTAKTDALAFMTDLVDWVRHAIGNEQQQVIKPINYDPFARALNILFSYKEGVYRIALSAPMVDIETREIYDSSYAILINRTTGTIETKGLISATTQAHAPKSSGSFNGSPYDREKWTPQTGCDPNTIDDDHFISHIKDVAAKLIDQSLGRKLTIQVEKGLWDEVTTRKTANSKPSIPLLEASAA
jgi:hypothetical protein